MTAWVKFHAKDSLVFSLGTLTERFNTFARAGEFSTLVGRVSLICDKDCRESGSEAKSIEAITRSIDQAILIGRLSSVVNRRARYLTFAAPQNQSA